MAPGGKLEISKDSGTLVQENSMMIDMHSHILPGLDDGAADWAQAIAMARVAAGDGIAEMVCTPHWVLGKYENNKEMILPRFADFEARLVDEKIPLKI